MISLASITKSDFTGSESEWQTVRATAAYVVTAGGKDTICGNSIEIEDAVSCAADKSPYGDVPYGDPGYKVDKVKRYPISTPEKIRAAWSYINMPKNHVGYTASEVSKIKARIVSAWKKKIDPKGPPSAK